MSTRKQKRGSAKFVNRNYEARKIDMNAYKPWTTEDDILLKNEFRNWSDVRQKHEYLITLKQGASYQPLPIEALTENLNVFTKEIRKQLFRSNNAIISRLILLEQIKIEN